MGEGELSSEVYWELFGGYYKNGMVLLNGPALSEGLVIGALIIISVLADIIRARRETR